MRSSRTNPRPSGDGTNKHYSPYEPPIGTITSLDDIINPYDYAAEYLDDQSVEGKAKYLHYLEEGKYLQQMQMAQYENWYNSPEQVALRQRAAGINPDLVGLQAAESASASAPEGSGVAALTPTDIAESQIRSQKIQNIMSIVNGVASVASLGVNAFSSLSMLPKQKQIADNEITAGNLTNASLEKSLLFTGLVDSGAGAITAALKAGDKDFNFADWLANSANTQHVFDAFNSGSPNSAAIWSSLLSNPEAIQEKAMHLAKSRVGAQYDLSEMAGSSYFDDSVVIQSGMLGPLMDATIQVRAKVAEWEQKKLSIIEKYASGLDVSALADSANRVAGAQGAEADYQNEYYSSLDAEQMAAYDFLIKESEKVAASMEKAINDNLLTVYNANRFNERGFAAAYLYCGGAAKDWKEYLIANELALGIERLNFDNEDTLVNPGFYSDFTGSSPNQNKGYRAFIPPGSVAIP